MAPHVLTSVLRRAFALSRVSEVRRRALATTVAPIPAQSDANTSTSSSSTTTAASSESGSKPAQDDELARKRKVIEMECYMLQEMGEPAPSVIPEHKWDELLNLPSVSARRRYFSYLFKTEKARENQVRRREEDKAAKARHREEVLAARAANEHIVYGLGQNTYLLKVYDRTIDMWGNYRLANAMKSGQPLVVDVGYDEHMTPRELRACADQLLLLFAANRSSRDPFHLHFCNAGQEGTLKIMERYMPTLRAPWLPISLSPDCFTRHYPKEKLIYLTPHCREDMRRWDHDAVYIVGAMVDKTGQEPLSLAKAKKLGLRMQRLPLDRHLEWGTGGKSLTVNQMMDILLDIKNTGDWKQALSHVPRRKLMKEEPKRNRRLPKSLRSSLLDLD